MLTVSFLLERRSPRANVNGNVFPGDAPPLFAAMATTACGDYASKSCFDASGEGIAFLLLESGANAGLSSPVSPTLNRSVSILEFIQGDHQGGRRLGLALRAAACTSGHVKLLLSEKDGDQYFAFPLKHPSYSHLVASFPKALPSRPSRRQR